jgi:3-hydroxyisobutyrate dehydrogenase-like beta-hydroxyacid dehydrogenase
MKYGKQFLGLGCLGLAMATSLLSGGVAIAQASPDDEPAAASFPDVDQQIKRLKKRVRQLETDVGVCVSSIGLTLFMRHLQP